MSNADRLRVFALTALVITAVLSGVSALTDWGVPWRDRIVTLGLAVVTNGILAGLIGRAIVLAVVRGRRTRQAVRRARQQESNPLSDSDLQPLPRHPGKVRYEVRQRQIFPYRW